MLYENYLVLKPFSMSKLKKILVEIRVYKQIYLGNRIFNISILEKNEMIQMITIRNNTLFASRQIYLQCTVLEDQVACVKFLGSFCWEMF